MQIYNDGSQSTPTGSTGGGGRVSLDDFSTLIALGHDVSELRSYANTARNRLETATGSADAFGSYPAGQAFATHHDAVAKVMSTTMDGVSTDIQSFGDNIVTSAKNYRDTDDTAAGCLQALKSVPNAPATVNDTFDAARVDQRDSLTDVRVDSDHAEATGAQDQTTEMLNETDDDAAGGNVDASNPAVADSGTTPQFKAR